MEIRGHERNRAWLRGWLYFVALTVLAVAVVGAGTRLTDSGLSITEWKPIHGIVPPLSEADWQEEFAKYQQIPEYLQVNKGMGLDAFKTIFWWEWAHRLLARIVVGLVFALPLAMFWMAGRIEVKLKPRLLALLALGGLQGFVGWWMVKSGLSQRVDVSQYRLAVHLTLACLIFAATLALARALAPHSAEPAQAPVRRTAGILVLALFVQIFLGALVAGLDAGMAYNTWPLMDGAVIPGDLFMIEPAWRNLFESPKTVQFVHRMTAYAIFALALLHALHASSAEAGTPHCARAWVLLALVLTQAAIGIWTLLSHIRMDTALLHQAMAFVVFGFAVAHWRGTAGPYPLPVGYDIRG
jgi:cytochrome c oxidase assembly protein subunit 15